MKIKYMHMGDFIEEGFLQEANRLFFHPHGLALQLTFSDSNAAVAQVCDYREDPEGIEFGEGVIDAGKAERVREEAERHREARAARWPPHGFQPEPGTQQICPWCGAGMGYNPALDAWTCSASTHVEADEEAEPEYFRS